MKNLPYYFNIKLEQLMHITEKKEGIHALILKFFGILLLYNTSVYRCIEKEMVKQAFWFVVCKRKLCLMTENTEF